MAKSTEKKVSAKTNKDGIAPLLKIDDPVYNQFGQPVYVTESGKIDFNQMSIARKFVSDEHIGMERRQETLLKFSPANGAWEPLPTSAVKLMLSEAVRKTAEQYKQSHLPFKTKPSFLNSLEQMTKVVAPAIITQIPDGLLLVKNGVLDLNDKPVLKEFKSEHGFTAASPLAYNANARCKRFLKELLGEALEEEDVSLVQRYFGSVLIGPNAAHRILIIKGTPGGGKSTLVSVLERIIGYDRVAYLRPPHLSGRFEFGGFLGKRLLTGKDVPGDALSVDGAKLLKSLVGGDLLEGEIKYATDKKQLTGDFHVVIACNNSLLIAPDEDPDAWRRRLLLVEFKRPKPAAPIPDFAEKLYQEEGEGILAWLVEGAMLHKKELKQIGNFKLTKEQQGRIDDLIDASRSVAYFVENCLKVTAGKNMAGQQIVDAYQAYCKKRNWTALTDRQVENQLGTVVMKVHGLTKRNDVLLNKKMVRGFYGIELVE